VPDAHPRHRGWLIPHPRFPLGFKHFLDPHQQATRLATLRVPWFPGLALPFVFEQRALHAWSGPPDQADGGDDTGQVLWRAAEVLSDYFLLKYAAPVPCSDNVPVRDQWAEAAAGAGSSGGGVSGGAGSSSGRSGGDRGGSGGGSGFRPRRVLELGCGACPLPSIAAGLCGHTVVGTDLPSQLVLAQRNVDSNAAALVALHLPLPPPPNDEDAASTGASSAAATTYSQAAAPAVSGRHAGRWLDALNVTLAPLPWGAPLPPGAWWAQPGAVDLVLGSDILYALPGQPAFFKELAATLGRLFRGAPAHAVAVFAYQHRSGVEQQFFDAVLPAAGFACTDVTDAAAAAGVGAHTATPGAVVAATGLLAQGLLRVIEVRLAV
jgi:predicted nicotinamide N-methyase